MGAAVGMVTSAAIATWSERLLGPPALDVALGVVAAALALAAVAGVGAGLVRAAGRARRHRGPSPPPPRRGPAWVWAWPATLVVLLIIPRVAPDRELELGITGVLALVVVATTWTGALLGAALAGRARGALPVALVAVALLLDGVVAVGLLHPGDASGVIAPLPPASGPALDLPDPGVPGPLEVTTFTYGSGTDGMPAAFAEDATLRTAPVDVSSVLEGVNPVFDAYLRTRFTGYDELPVNGRVWLPTGGGPFPLVLIVHGNHALGDDSSAGYAYLGDHLASHGVATASIDQNLLNSNVFGDGGRAAMPLRAYLLLEHLRWWQRWTQEDGNPLAGRIDLDRVVLAGHSRGGEAAAHAAALHDRPRPPVAGLLTPAHVGATIRGVVALAPVDGMWQPGGAGPTLEDTSYLLLHGAHDGDLPGAQGLRQHARVHLTAGSDAFAAVAYLQRANHGQFNTGWGRGDIGSLDALLLDRARLLSGAEQQRAARSLVTGFVLAVTGERTGYRSLFTRPDAARDWLPDDVVVTSFRDGTFRPLVDPDRPLDGQDLTTAGVALERATPQNRDGSSTDDPALAVTWDAGADPTIEVPVEEAAGSPVQEEDALTLRWVPTAEAHPAADITVTVRDVDGVSASLPVSEVTSVRPLLPAQLLRSEVLTRLLGTEVPHVTADANVVLQTYELPLARFRAEEPALRVDHLEAVTLRFDDARAGAGFLDDVGLRRPTASEMRAAG